MAKSTPYGHYLRVENIPRYSNRNLVIMSTHLKRSFTPTGKVTFESTGAAYDDPEVLSDEEGVGEEEPVPIWKRPKIIAGGVAAFIVLFILLMAVFKVFIKKKPNVNSRVDKSRNSSNNDNFESGSKQSVSEQATSSIREFREQFSDILKAEGMNNKMKAFGRLQKNRVFYPLAIISVALSILVIVYFAAKINAARVKDVTPPPTPEWHEFARNFEWKLLLTHYPKHAVGMSVTGALASLFIMFLLFIGVKRLFKSAPLFTPNNLPGNSPKIIEVKRNWEKMREFDDSSNIYYNLLSETFLHEDEVSLNYLNILNHTARKDFIYSGDDTKTYKVSKCNSDPDIQKIFYKDMPSKDVVELQDIIDLQESIIKEYWERYLSQYSLKVLAALQAKKLENSAHDIGGSLIKYNCTAGWSTTSHLDTSDCCFGKLYTNFQRHILDKYGNFVIVVITEDLGAKVPDNSFDITLHHFHQKNAFTNSFVPSRSIPLLESLKPAIDRTVAYLNTL